MADADLVLLDLGLPDMDGSEVCRQVRKTSAVPIIIVSARGDESDRVLGLELGADDYLVKPFGLRELVARVRAVSRRAVSDPDQLLQRVGAVEIDRRARRVTVDEREVALSPKEFDLLSLLGQDPGAVVSREQIMDEVWDPHWYGPTRTLDVHVASLRKKLGDPGLIETVRRVGFRLRDRVRRRMILANLALVFAVLLVLEVPLALVYTRHEHDALDAALQRDAAALAVLAGEVAELPGGQDLAELAHRYSSEPAGLVAIVDSAGRRPDWRQRALEGSWLSRGARCRATAARRARARSTGSCTWPSRRALEEARSSSLGPMSRSINACTSSGSCSSASVSQSSPSRWPSAAD